VSRLDSDLSEASIAVLVDRFYDKVRVDATLGPVFNAVVDDWDAHKRRLTSFWATVALGSRTYRGNPLGMHRPLSIEAAHFERWLALWRETTHELLGPRAAALMTAYAGRIAVGLRVGLGIDERPRDRESALARSAGT
jgi:hemoglobin